MSPPWEWLGFIAALGGAALLFFAFFIYFAVALLYTFGEKNESNLE